MTFFKELASKRPMLKHKLIMAHIDSTPEAYVKKSFMSALMLTCVITVGFFLIGTSFGWNPLFYVGVFFGSLILLFYLLSHTVDVVIRKRAKEIDKEVLFAGRFLLVKLHAGSSLMGAIVDASKSYGVAGSYFKEIVRDIELGTPFEEAIEKAARYSPSEDFRRIIFQIANALRIGVDVTNFLEATIDDIAESQLIEIKRYGKKLNGLTMFYMLLAIIVPSLGITLFITVVSFLSINVGLGLFFMILFLLVVFEFFFMTLFKASRPNVNI